MGRRGLVVLASDLLDTDPDALAPLSRIAALGHDVMVLHVMHPFELEFPYRQGLEGHSRFRSCGKSHGGKCKAA